MEKTPDPVDIIYINFSPYENTGNILTYLNNNFLSVALFVFNFHKLSERQTGSTLTIIKRNKTVKHTRLYQTPTTETFAFVLLPVRSLVIFIQILYHTLQIRFRTGPCL